MKLIYIVLTLAVSSAALLPLESFASEIVIAPGLSVEVNGTSVRCQGSDTPDNVSTDCAVRNWEGFFSGCNRFPFSFGIVKNNELVDGQCYSSALDAANAIPALKRAGLCH